MSDERKIEIDGTEYIVNLNPGEVISAELLADKLGFFDVDDGSMGEADEEKEIKVTFRRG